MSFRDKVYILASLLVGALVNQVACGILGTDWGRVGVASKPGNHYERNVSRTFRGTAGENTPLSGRLLGRSASVAAEENTPVIPSRFLARVSAAAGGGEENSPMVPSRLLPKVRAAGKNHGLDRRRGAAVQVEVPTSTIPPKIESVKALIPAWSARLNETSAERMERVHRAFEKMLTLVNIASQVDDYVSSKVKTVVKKVSGLVDSVEIVSSKNPKKCH